MKENNLLKQAVVLLLIALMVFSSGAVMAKTPTHDLNIVKKEANPGNQFR